MIEKENKLQFQKNQEDQSPRRPWLKPAFERLSLDEAMSGTNYPEPTDGPGYGS